MSRPRGLGRHGIDPERRTRGPAPPDFVPPRPPADLTPAVVRFAAGIGAAYLLFHLPNGPWRTLYALAGAAAAGALSAALFAATAEIRRRWRRAEVVERHPLRTVMAGVVCYAIVMFAGPLIPGAATALLVFGAAIVAAACVSFVFSVDP